MHRLFEQSRTRAVCGIGSGLLELLDMSCLTFTASFRKYKQKWSVTEQMGKDSSE